MNGLISISIAILRNVECTDEEIFDTARNPRSIIPLASDAPQMYLRAALATDNQSCNNSRVIREWHEACINHHRIDLLPR